MTKEENRATDKKKLNDLESQRGRKKKECERRSFEMDEF